MQADLKTFAAFGVYGTNAVTLVTAQNTVELDAVEIMSGDLVARQIAAVMADFEVAVVKIGAVGSVENVRVVADAIDRHDWSTVVLDPVVVASVGTALASTGVLNALRTLVLPRSTLVTPNLREAAALTGLAVRTPEDMERAARNLVSQGAGAALVTGGHLAGEEMVDVLFDGNAVIRLTHARQDSAQLHGTGCTLASAVAAGRAQGIGLVGAVERAVRYVQLGIAAAPGLGRGAGPLAHDVDPERETWR